MGDQVKDIFWKVWTKLQGLPEAGSLDVGAFVVLLLFVATVISMIILSCTHECWFKKPKHQPSRVQPIHSA